MVESEVPNSGVDSVDCGLKMLYFQLSLAEVSAEEAKWKWFGIDGLIDAPTATWLASIVRVRGTPELGNGNVGDARALLVVSNTCW